MKLVSAAKLKKAQDAVTASREYTDALSQMLGELAGQQGLEFTHPLMEARPEVKTIRIFVLGGSRGLCGAFNSNVNKMALRLSTELAEQHPGAKLEWVLLGKKPAEHFRRSKIAYLKSFEDLPEDANEWPVDQICRELEADFLTQKVDAAYVIYTRFKSAMSQKAMSEKLLPMDAELDLGNSATPQESEQATGMNLFEPSPAAVFKAIIPRILRTTVRQAGLDTKASEHGSRMVAMDAATNNAGDLIHSLTLTHNKLRQSAITSELLDIVGGAAALEG